MRIIIAAAVALAVLALLGPPATYVLADGYPDFRDRSPLGTATGGRYLRGATCVFPRARFGGTTIPDKSDSPAVESNGGGITAESMLSALMSDGNRLRARKSPRRWKTPRHSGRLPICAPSHLEAAAKTDGGTDVPGWIRKIQW